MKSNKVDFKKKLKVKNIQTMNFNMSHRLFLLFICGIVAGTFILNLLLGGYAHKFGIYSEYFVNGVNMYGESVDKAGFFWYCFKKYLVEFLVIFVANLTPVGKWFNYGYCVYKGIVISTLISSATLTYGAGGLFLYIISIFPHYLMYVPFIVASLYISIQVVELIKEKKTRKFKLRAVLILLILVVGTSFLEAYVNYPLLRAVFS